MMMIKKTMLIKKLIGGVGATALTMSVAGLLGSVSAPTAAAAPSTAAAAHSVAHSSAKKSKVTLPKRCKVKGHVLCADKTKRKLYYLESGKIKKTLDARFGCSGSRHTRQGTFKVQRKSKHWVSTIYHTAMPYSMFFSGGQAVHYSADFKARGYNGCSHGCVNVRNMSRLKYVYKRMHVGDRVVVYRS